MQMWQYYDTVVKTLLSDVTFRNIQLRPDATNGGNGASKDNGSKLNFPLQWLILSSMQLISRLAP